MFAEQYSVEKRVARHAALADPARLRIVDLLALGDRSPGELRDALALPSNLLAHHLGTLERAGIVARGRSEGDRRRSYIRLLPEALEHLGPDVTAAADRIVFVCTGNSARSPLAVALWQEASNIPAVSAGTQPARATAPGAIAAAERHGLSLADHTPRAIADVLTEDDFLVTLCDRARECLPAVTLHWSIPNPTPKGTRTAYENAFQQIAHRVQRLSHNLTPA